MSDPKIAEMNLRTPLYKKASCLSLCGQGVCVLGVGATLFLPVKMRVAPLWAVSGVATISAIAYGVARSQEKFIEVEAEAEQDVHAYYLAHHTADRVRQIEAYYVGKVVKAQEVVPTPIDTIPPAQEFPNTPPSQSREVALVKASKGVLN